MARAKNIYIVANFSRPDEIFGLFTVKHEAISFMKRGFVPYTEHDRWYDGFCLIRSKDGQEYDPVEIDLTTL